MAAARVTLSLWKAKRRCTQLCMRSRNPRQAQVNGHGRAHNFAVATTAHTSCLLTVALLVQTRSLMLTAFAAVALIATPAVAITPGAHRRIVDLIATSRNVCQRPQHTLQHDTRPAQRASFAKCTATYLPYGNPCATRAEGLAVLDGAKCTETCVATGHPCKDGAKFAPCCKGDATCVTLDGFAQCMPLTAHLPTEHGDAKQVQCRAPHARCLYVGGFNALACAGPPISKQTATTNQT